MSLSLMWLVYGGWRGYHHIIVEPRSRYPNRLREPVQQNTHRTLRPSERFLVEVAVTVYRGEEGYQGALRRLEAVRKTGCKKTLLTCHSERSEESRFAKKTLRTRFLAALGMTVLLKEKL